MPVRIGRYCPCVGKLNSKQASLNLVSENFCKKQHFCKQDMKEQGTKRSREQVDGERFFAKNEEIDGEYYDADGDKDAVQVEVTTAEGVTQKFLLPPTATVNMVKQGLEREHGIPPTVARVFVSDDARETELGNKETMGSLRRAKRAKVEMAVLVDHADAQHVVNAMSSDADLVLGTVKEDSDPACSNADLFAGIKPGDWCMLAVGAAAIVLPPVGWGLAVSFVGAAAVASVASLARSTGNSIDRPVTNPTGIAFVPTHPDWRVIADGGGGRRSPTEPRVQIFDAETGRVICKCSDLCGAKRLGSVVITSDGKFVLVDHCGTSSGGVLVLRLETDATGSNLEYVRTIGPKDGGNQMALLLDEGGQETLLMILPIPKWRFFGETGICQIALDGTFIRTFGGDQGDSFFPEFDGIGGIAVMPSGEVAVSDCWNHRVVIFDNNGRYERQFGSEGDYLGEYPADGELFLPMGLASDAHGNLLVVEATRTTEANYCSSGITDRTRNSRLQLFSSSGKHLCTRNDIGLLPGPGNMNDFYHKTIAWGANGHLAIANDGANEV
jgi:hypothetical protein